VIVAIEELLARLRQESEHETYPVATADDTAATERALGRPLPESFKRFQMEFSNGAYLFMLQEVSATGAGNRQVGAIQAVLRNVIVAAADDDISVDSGAVVKAGDLVPYSLDGNGNCWCFLTSESAAGDEYAVAYYVTDQDRLVGRLPGFEAWLTTLVNEQDEVIRTIYDWDELDLG
jgi:hypothetical protein